MTKKEGRYVMVRTLGSVYLADREALPSVKEDSDMVLFRQIKIGMVSSKGSRGL